MKQFHSNQKRRFFTLIMALLAMSGPLAAQEELSVQGTVRDAKTGEAMPFANVGLMRTADTVFVRGATTDLEGRFQI